MFIECKVLERSFITVQFINFNFVIGFIKAEYGTLLLLEGTTISITDDIEIISYKLGVK